MQITLHLPPDAELQLIAVAKKTSGSDTPSQQQLDSAFGALAHWALQKAYEQVSVPERVAGSLPTALAKTLARALGTIVLLALLFLAPGCMVARYERIPARCECAYTARLISRIGDGPSPCSCSTNQNDAVRFRLVTFLVNEKVAKVSVDKFTGKTHSGIVIGTAESTVDDDALKAIVSAAVETTIKAFLGL